MKPLTLSLLVAVAFATPAFAKDKDKEKQGEGDKRTAVITMAQCPVAVQTAIQAYKGTINEIEAEQEKGVVTYDAKLTLADGKRLKILLAADGKLLESKEKKAK